jgi:hypothetical protein
MRYGYAGMNPIANRDPSGRDFFGALGALVSNTIQAIGRGLSSAGAWVVRMAGYALRGVTWIYNQFLALALRMATGLVRFSQWLWDFIYLQTVRAATGFNWLFYTQQGQNSLFIWTTGVSAALQLGPPALASGLEFAADCVDRWDQNTRVVVGVGPAAGNEIERMSGANLGGNVRTFDDFRPDPGSQNGTASSVRAHAVASEEALYAAIRDDIHEMVPTGNPNNTYEGTTSTGQRIILREGNINQRALVVAVPWQDAHMVNETLAGRIANYLRGTAGNIRVVVMPVRSWARSRTGR